MLNPNSLKAKPADNYDDLKKQFFALKNLCESKIKQCSIYSKKLAEYDRETIIARNEALESEREMNAQLTDEIEKANEREKRLEKILQRYESEQLQPLKQRVKELESAILDSCSTYHFEPDLSQPASSLNELLIINSKWTLDPEISSDASKFATEKICEGALLFADYLNDCKFNTALAAKDGTFNRLAETLCNTLSKEQE